MKTFKYLLLPALCLLLSASCKKTINVPKNNPIDSVKTVDSFRMSYVVYTAPNNARQTYRLTYDSNNNVDSLITDDTMVTKFFYYAGYYQKATYGVGSGHATFTQSINMDGQGNITNTNGSTPELLVYNANEQVIRAIVAVDTLSYHWDSNGNADTLNAPGTVLYSYDLSKRGQPGDMEHIEGFLLYGKMLVKTNNVHIAKSVPGSADSTRYTYTYDNWGRITSASESGVTGGYTYTYY